MRPVPKAVLRGLEHTKQVKAALVEESQGEGRRGLERRLMTRLDLSRGEVRSLFRAVDEAYPRGMKVEASEDDALALSLMRLSATLHAGTR